MGSDVAVGMGDGVAELTGGTVALGDVLGMVCGGAWQLASKARAAKWVRRYCNFILISP